MLHTGVTINGVIILTLKQIFEYSQLYSNIPKYEYLPNIDLSPIMHAYLNNIMLRRSNLDSGAN